ncbi:hypothetical protein [Marinoscillum sp.]|uniref:hypothetical protein n=1 Tax=Marinoscillum sp. TaxID=2024838 RepID=UPI003BAC0704
MSNHFDISRFWNLLKLELFKSRKGVLMIMVILFGMLFFVGFLLSLYIEGPAVYDHIDSYVSALLIGGFIVSSLAFADIDRQLKRIHYLMMPVSTLERFICMWLLTGIGWLIVFTISFTIYVMIANPIGQMVFPETSFKSFSPFGGIAWTTMRVYMVLQGIFLLGAAYFRGYVFPKTAVVIFSILIVVGVVVFFSLKAQFLADHYCTTDGECELVDAFAVHPVWLVAKGLFWYVLAPLTWVLAYWGLKDQGA